MALSASSVLHYWSARYGSVPIVGGKPVHTRSSGAKWTDQKGNVSDAVINTPRFPWATVDGERRPVMRLEQARTNIWPYSQDFSNATAGWALSNLTHTANAGIAPDGTLTAAKIAATATAVTNNNRSLGAIGSSAIAFSVFFRPITTGISLAIGVYNSTTATNVVFGNINTTTGAFTLSGGSVVGATVSSEAVGGGWYRLAVFAPITSGHTYSIYCGWSGGPSTAGDAAYFWGAQVETSASPSGYVPTLGATATRAADSFYWDYTPPPQAMMVYARFMERGSAINGNAVFSVTSSGEAFPLVRLYSIGGAYIWYHNNGSVASNNIFAAAPSVGDVVEVVGVLYADGHVRGIQSLNGAAVSSTVDATTAALAASWGDTRLYLNSRGASSPGTSDFAEIRIVKYADVVAVTDQGIMDELRAFEMNAAGEVLV